MRNNFSPSIPPNTTMYRFIKRLQLISNSCRISVPLIILIFLMICFIFGDMMQIGSSVGISKDRADIYDVKVLPNDITDDALNKLEATKFSYLAIVDAGSSGCRAHVYRYGKLGSLSGPLYVLPHHTSKKIKPGLSSFANNPEDAGESLSGLIEFLKSQVPESYWSKTPIWVKATAGLRLLALDKKEKSDAVLKSVVKYLNDKTKCPFSFVHLGRR